MANEAPKRARPKRRTIEAFIRVEKQHPQKTKRSRREELLGQLELELRQIGPVCAGIYRVRLEHLGETSEEAEAFLDRECKPTTLLALEVDENDALNGFQFSTAVADEISADTPQVKDKLAKAPLLI